MNDNTARGIAILLGTALFGFSLGAILTVSDPMWWQGGLLGAGLVLGLVIFAGGLAAAGQQP